MHPEAPNGSAPVDLTIELAETKAELTASRRELTTLRAALQAAGAREQKFASELQHRVQNIFAVLRSIYRRTLERGASHEEFAEHFAGRLDAIARYQNAIAGVGSGGLELEDMVREELLAVQCVDGPDCTIAGPPVRLSNKRCELMGLAIHELTTNSIKFGALYHRGSLSVEWSLIGSPATLRFCWRETGVPLLAESACPRGFGRDLIEEALPYQLGATTSFEIRPDGLACSITLPLTNSHDPSRIAWAVGNEITAPLQSQSQQAR